MGVFPFPTSLDILISLRFEADLTFYLMYSNLQGVPRAAQVWLGYVNLPAREPEESLKLWARKVNPMFL